VHVLVPITRRSTFEDTRDFADGVATVLAERNPGLVTTEWRKAKRRGVFLDARQNGWGKTIASAYSVRPKPGAPVSTPLRWEELSEEVSPRDFDMQEALRRIEDLGDLFRPLLDEPQALAPARRALAQLRRRGSG
jgi:bifunctional non-homologous end joining protein LigD